MKYTELGLVNTRKMFQDAIAGKYAIPAFNIYNMETLMAVMSAVQVTHSPVILGISESALKYMGFDMLTGMILGANITQNMQICLHLDHGSSFEICRQAIQNGFSSVMIDASKLPLDNNIQLTKQVVDYAHEYNVCVESELGTLSGIEDETTHGTDSCYTNPSDVERFVKQTGTDSLAISIGTSHGAFKRTSATQELRFDILSEIAERMPNFPLVLHGASSIPADLVNTINEYGGNLSGALGIPTAQIRRATQMNICKVNVDSDLRLAFTAAVRKNLAENPGNFNPRDFLSAARTSMTEICINEIRNVMGSENKR